jgi:hypothetical protein
MARLYRRFGFATRATSVSETGKECALIHGNVKQVATALKVPLQQDFAVLQ